MSTANEKIVELMRRCFETRTGLPYADELIENARHAMGVLLAENKRLLELADASMEDQARFMCLMHKDWAMACALCGTEETAGTLDEYGAEFRSTVDALMQTSNVSHEGQHERKWL